LDRLADERFILLTTFRNDGRAVQTPVGVARDGFELLVWTSAESGKVKRIRRDGTVEIGPCDSRGTPTGDSVSGTARILDQPGIEHARAVIQRKYGLLARVVIFLNRLRYGPKHAAATAITLRTD
jgi:PPOX class probable F420-dependent enzyme